MWFTVPIGSQIVPMENRLKVRYALRDPSLLHQLMTHPGRGTPYSTRTLAEAADCHHSLIHRLLTGSQDSCEVVTAHDIAEALGVAVLVLFAPPASPNRIDSAADEIGPY